MMGRYVTGPRGGDIDNQPCNTLRFIYCQGLILITHQNQMNIGCTDPLRDTSPCLRITDKPPQDRHVRGRLISLGMRLYRQPLQSTICEKN